MKPEPPEPTVLDFEELDPKKRHFIGRLFSPPIAERDPVTGQPQQKFTGMAIFSLDETGEMELKGLVEVPEKSFQFVRRETFRQFPFLRRFFGVLWNGARRDTLEVTRPTAHPFALATPPCQTQPGGSSLSNASSSASVSGTA